ncbi:CopG family transcriptional regulator [Marispirochaeta aestuarii]|uniref:CopG family transcriptional regulator n=1 Tax=Marispirochaeta aestuarii TaxID=1963862 RepID=UPI0029C6D037|nr:CopG family transcriptional regulator [Marispirochaeta aestuarii]
MKKESVVTFKADEKLAELLHALPNRSEFIRKALLEALDSTCPLCQGSGILTPAQREHWEVFSRHHRVGQCRDGCGETILFCDYQLPESSGNAKEF